MEWNESVLGGNYHITTDGVITSKPRQGSHGGLLNPKINKHGYKQVSIWIHRVMYSKLVHRLVAEVYIPNTENKPYVNHINGNKLDNRVENLEWCTSSENQIHAYRIGLKKPKNKRNNLGRYI